MVVVLVATYHTYDHDDRCSGDHKNGCDGCGHDDGGSGGHEDGAGGARYDGFMMSGGGRDGNCDVDGESGGAFRWRWFWS